MNLSGKFSKSLMRRKWIFILLLFVIANTAAVAAESERLRVGFICEAGPDHPFWRAVVDVMQAAADDLNIDLVVQYDPTRSTITTKKLGERLINSEPKLDYLLTKYQLSVTAKHINQSQDRGIKVFVFNSDVPESEYETTGRYPRQKFDNWIGHMVPDDQQAGYDQAAALIERARAKKTGDKIYVLGLDAPYESTVGTSRQAGLKSKIKEAPDVVLQDIVLINWEAVSAGQRILELLKQYPKTDILWSPDGTITWGAVQGLEQGGKKPGQDILVGGFDWTPESIKAIEDGRISASMFGHFVEGAWALILAHDYHYGFDFADSPGVRISTPLTVLSAENYEKYKRIISENKWAEIDFRQFSKKYNPQLKSYNFNINQFIK
ncbi:MAG: ABC transporter substrate-binding protein [Gammaproteobacteria bacterium]|nr:ABC transporter substrate-binding protein [Gammaproteobacteria bacterium]